MDEGSLARCMGSEIVSLDHFEVADPGDSYGIKMTRVCGRAEKAHPLWRHEAEQYNIGACQRLE